MTTSQLRDIQDAARARVDEATGVLRLVIAYLEMHEILEKVVAASGPVEIEAPYGMTSASAEEFVSCLPGLSIRHNGRVVKKDVERSKL